MEIYLQIYVLEASVAQVTIYLDDESDARLKEAARAEGLSVSKWIARLIEEKTRNEWPPGLRALSGAWAGDFPEAEQLRRGVCPDLPRETL